MEEFYIACSENRVKKGKTKVLAKQYKLGEVIANGVRYFGALPYKGNKIMIKAICPLCGEIWGVSLYHVQSGNSKSCCNSGTKGRV